MKKQQTMSGLFSGADEYGHKPELSQFGIIRSSFATASHRNTRNSVG